MARRAKQGLSDPFNSSGKLNNLAYNFYYRRLKELAISMFEWKGFPDSIDTRFLELTLFEDGCAVIFEDEVLGLLGLQVLIGGNLDVYRVPKERRAYAVNGYQNPDLNEGNSVIVFNNMLRTNCVEDINFFCRKLYEIDRSIDVNVKQQKTPGVILADENERLTMLNLFQKYDGNQPFIFGSKNLDLKNIQYIGTNAPYVSDKLYTLKNQVWNEALTYLGINNVNMIKKERLVSDEVERNAGGINASRNSRLEMRQTAAKKINEMFGLNVSVEYRENIEKFYEDLVDEGGGYNE